MGYLAAVILAIFLVVLFISSPGFRVFVGVVFVVAALGVAHAIHYEKEEKASREKEIKLKSDLIPITNLFVQDPIASNESGPRYFRARIHNRDGRHTVDSVSVQVTYTDCVSPQDCVMLGQTDLEFTQDIPPGQARDVTAYMMNWPHTAKGTIEWSFELKRILAK